MIEAKQVSKQFAGQYAVKEVSAQIASGSVFGLIGSNGAGKSTFLRMLAGVLKPDMGEVFLDGTPIFENVDNKKRCFYISDDQYFFANSTPNDLKRFYQTIYDTFDVVRFAQLLDAFGLDGNRKINTFSKGMRKQISVICGLSTQVNYLFCDETFDGLDPVARQVVKGLFAADMVERGLTPIIASHNLRELEDICDSIGLLHQGGILFESNLEDMKLGIHKIQCVFQDKMDIERIRQDLKVLHLEKRGTLYLFTLKGERQHLESYFSMLQPLFFEVLPLSLEEIFIAETEVAGYDIKKILF